jgi:hypothetical protein
VLSGHKQKKPSGHRQDVPIELANSNANMPDPIAVAKSSF